MDLSKFRLLGENVLIEGIKIKKKGKIIIPDSYEDKPELGTVLALGHGRLLENGDIVPFEFKVGDVILFNKYSSTKFNLDGKDFVICRGEDIVAVK